MSFYQSLKQTASKLLTNYGQSVTFSREVSSGFDPVTGQDTTTTETFSGYGAAFDYNQSEIDDSIIQQGDIRLMVQAVDTKPQSGDACSVNGTDYRVMSVMDQSPGGTSVYYEVQLRV